MRSDFKCCKYFQIYRSRALARNKWTSDGVTEQKPTISCFVCRHHISSSHSLLSDYPLYTRYLLQSHLVTLFVRTFRFRQCSVSKGQPAIYIVSSHVETPLTMTANVLFIDKKTIRCLLIHRHLVSVHAFDIQNNRMTNFWPPWRPYVHI